jgi:hypothetical protein
MSSSRSIAAARQRRGVESAPPIKQNNYASSNKDNMNNVNNNAQGRINYKTTKSNIYQDNTQQSNVNTNINNQVSKLSISDAFALVTLRLGRVELIINKLQSAGILDANNNIISEKMNNGSISDNFDDTILQNIMTRLDGLDKKTISNDLNQKLQSQYNFLQEEIKDTKNMMVKLQSFIMENSQKLNNFITNQESINANQESINEEFFDLRDMVEENNKVSLNAIDVDEKLDSDANANANNSINLQDNDVDNKSVINDEELTCSQESIECNSQEIKMVEITTPEDTNPVIMPTEIIVDNTTKKHKNNKSKTMNLNNV